ncbi:MAG: hypothetical protein LBM69_09365, partial [Lachnospiraceae bacterium]|nr:hypothetical protein [Lachnospiraceae bacterium]
MNTMNLSFNDSTKELFAICSVEFESSMDELRFSLSDKMSFDNIDADAPAKLSKTRDWQPTFADHCNEYSITGGFRTLTVTYHGKPQGWCNIIEERRIALSSYSSWFPFGDELPSDWLIRLDGMPDYIVINGEYDAARNVWTYGQKGFDVGNIILLKASQWNRVEDGDFSFWYANEREQEFAAIFAK